MLRMAVEVGVVCVLGESGRRAREGSFSQAAGGEVDSEGDDVYYLRRRSSRWATGGGMAWGEGGSEGGKGQRRRRSGVLEVGDVVGARPVTDGWRGGWILKVGGTRPEVPN